MTRLDFLKGRQLGIGGSDMPTILGLRPNYNALDVYHSKTRPIDESTEDDPGIDIQRGNNLEDQARVMYWQHTGRRGRNVTKPIRHPEYPAFRCHLDFEIFSDDTRPEPFRGPGIGETKCPRAFVLRKIADHGMRRSELIQGLTYAAVARRDWAGFNFFSWEYDGGPTLPIDVPADPKLGAFLLETGQRFFDEHVVPRVPPDPDEWALLGNTVAADVDEHVRKSSGALVTVAGDSEFGSDVARMMELKQLKKRTEEAYEEIGAHIKRFIEEHSESDRVQIPGVGKVTIVRNSGRVSFSRSALAGHRPIDRDKLFKWLTERYLPSSIVESSMVSNTGRVADAILAELELDLSAFERTGEPYAYVLPTPEKQQ